MKKILIIVIGYCTTFCSVSKPTNTAASTQSNTNSSNSGSIPVSKEEKLNSKNYVNAKGLKQAPINKKDSKIPEQKRESNTNQNNSTPIIKSE